MICKECGKDSNVDFSFCPHCGKQRITQIVCPSCAYESSANFSFCPQCGKAFSSIPSASVPLDSLPDVEVVDKVSIDNQSTTSISLSNLLNDTDDIGTYTFGAFAVITLLVAIAHGIRPIELIETAIWAGAAWYWHSKKTHSELAKAVVLVLAALVAIVEIISVVHHFNETDSKSVSQSATAYSSYTAPTEYSSTSNDNGSSHTDNNQGSSSNTMSSTEATLLVICDLACNWKLDGEIKGRIASGGSANAKVELGQHVLIAVTDDGLDKIEKNIEIKKIGQTIFHIDLKPIRSDRIQAEHEADPGYLRAHANENAKAGQELYDQKQYEQAKPLLEKACFGDAMAACVSLGYILEHENGLWSDQYKNFLQARSLYQKACDNGLMSGCRSLGDTYFLGNYSDYNKSSSLFKKACDGGDMWGCSNLALSYKSGYGVPKDHAHALELYQKACKGGFDWACHELSDMQYPSQ